jgi:hypothetical protein
MKFIAGSILSLMLCPLCFPSRWDVKTIAVPCQLSHGIKAEWRNEGRKIYTKRWSYPDDKQIICDMIGIK